MQRSVNKKASSEPSTPNGPPSKRMRMSDGTSGPGTPNTPRTPTDHEVLVASLAAEKKKEEEAIAKAAEAAGESRWVLSFKDPRDGAGALGMNVVQAGFSTIDAESDDSDEEEVSLGRMKFGGGVKREACHKMAMRLKID